MTSLDEAMVAATAGEVADPVVFGDVCCLVTRAAEEAGDASRLERWTEVTLAFMQRTGHPPLLEFCGTCCAEVLLVTASSPRPKAGMKLPLASALARRAMASAVRASVGRLATYAQERAAISAT